MLRSSYFNEAVMWAFPRLQSAVAEIDQVHRDPLADAAFADIEEQIGFEAAAAGRLGASILKGDAAVPGG
jgi:hypothetical protein